MTSVVVRNCLEANYSSKKILLQFLQEQIDTEKLIKRVNRPTDAIKKVIEKLERASDREKSTNVFMKELNIPAHLSDE